jgi:hypothetical protein
MFPIPLVCILVVGGASLYLLVRLVQERERQPEKHKHKAKAETPTPAKAGFDWGKYVPHGVTYDRITDSYHLSTNLLLNEGQFILPHEVENDEVEPPTEDDVIINKARQLWQTGKRHEAITLLETLPDNPKAQHILEEARQRLAARPPKYK